MTDTPIYPDGNARGFQLRSPLVRTGPWVTDGVWVAHHALKGFARVHQYLPTNGWWRLTETGPQSVAQPVPDVAAYMARLDELAEPCIVAELEAPSHADMDEAMAHATEYIDRVEVVAQDGTIVYFDAQVAFLASALEDRWTWKLAAPIGDRTTWALTGHDRKGRIRFALAEVVQGVNDGSRTVAP